VISGSSGLLHAWKVMAIRQQTRKKERNSGPFAHAGPLLREKGIIGARNSQVLDFSGRLVKMIM
jgi:hypothetical protein